LTFPEQGETDHSVGSLARQCGVPARSFGDANALQRALRNAAATTPGAAVLKRTGHHLDRAISRLTGGRTTFSTLLTGIPVVMLTTTGARSGRQRTVAVAGIPHPDGLGVIASNFGQDKHPAWYHNLKANPEAVVSVAGEEWKTRERRIEAFVLERQFG
jgi:deazaflavin-dependent oxidoreductase (nitroreductase family)